LVNCSQHSAPYDIPPAWESVLRSITEQAGLCIVIGPTDAGKSSFCLLAANFALQAGRKAAFLDTDPGQSHLGPPAALGLALVERPLARLEEALPHGMYFIGATSPVGHLLEVAVGAARLAQRARQIGADLIIVNTSGLVRGGPARALKAAKISLLSPSHIISISPRGETEGILAGVRGRHFPVVYRLFPSRRAVRRDAEERRRRREGRFAAYFHSAGEIRVDFSGLAIQGGGWLSGEPLEGVSLSYAEECLEAEVLWGERTAEGAFFIVQGTASRFGERSLAESFGGEIKVVEKAFLENLLVGLLDQEGEDLGLGMIREIDFAKKKMLLFSPIARSEHIGGLRLGNIRITPSGEELGGLPASFWG